MDTKRKILSRSGFAARQELVFRPRAGLFLALGLETMPTFGASGLPGRDEPLS